MSCLYQTNLFTNHFFHKPTITSPKDTDLHKPTNTNNKAKIIHNLIIPKLHNLSTKTKYANTDTPESTLKHTNCKDSLNIKPVQIIEPYSNKTERIHIIAKPYNNKRIKHYKNHLIRTFNVNNNNNSNIEHCMTNSLREDQKSSSRELRLNKQNKTLITNIKLPNCNNIIISAVSFSKRTECIICNKIFLEHQLVCTNICKHFFCQECIGEYFQNKLFTLSTDLNSTSHYQMIKCPVYSCNEMFNVDIIKQNISKQFINYLDNLNCSIKYCIDEYQNIKCNNSNSNKHIYLNDHLLLINNNQSVYNYNNNKKEICPNCNLFSLYHKKGMKWLICLNCFKRFCYFCLKHYKKSHFKLFSINRCKVFFRNETINTITNNQLKASTTKNKNSFCSNYWLNVLYVFAGYFICWIGNIKNIKTIVSHCILQQCKTNKPLLTFLKKLIYYITFITLSILLSVSMLILIPYFAIITSI